MPSNIMKFTRNELVRLGTRVAEKLPQAMYVRTRDRSRDEEPRMR